MLNLSNQNYILFYNNKHVALLGVLGVVPKHLIKPTRRPTQRLHRCCRLIENYEEIANQARILYLLAAETEFCILGSSGISSKHLSCLNLKFSVLPLLMSLKCLFSLSYHYWCLLPLLMSLRCLVSLITTDVSQMFSKQVVQRGLNTVIAFSWRDCAGFQFGGYFTIDIWHHMLCYFPHIGNYIMFTSSIEGV